MSAVFSADRLLRFELRRKTGLGSGRVTFVMFNPSTADEESNDPTIRRCIGFANRWGFGELVVVNLLPIRSPDPAEAWRWYRSLIGAPPSELATNAYYIRRSAEQSDVTVAAWGSIAKSIGWDARDKFSIDFQCLGVNSDGQPKHPLYVAKSTELRAL